MRFPHDHPRSAARKIAGRKIAAFAAAPLAILLAGGMVWQGTHAAFTATTRNSGNSWSTGQVLLTDDDDGRAGFTVTKLLPGETGQRCLTVTSGSNVAGEVRLYLQNFIKSAQGLEDHLKMTLDMGTGGSFSDCTGFTPSTTPVAAQPLSALAARSTSYETSGTAWATTGTPGESKTYRATWTFDTAGLSQGQVDALQGAQTSVDLVWELQSTDR